MIFYRMAYFVVLAQPTIKRSGLIGVQEEVVHDWVINFWSNVSNYIAESSSFALRKISRFRRSLDTVKVQRNPSEAEWRELVIGLKGGSSKRLLVLPDSDFSHSGNVKVVVIEEHQDTVTCNGFLLRAPVGLGSSKIKFGDQNLYRLTFSKLDFTLISCLSLHILREGEIWGEVHLSRSNELKAAYDIIAGASMPTNVEFQFLSERLEEFDWNLSQPDITEESNKRLDIADWLLGNSSRKLLAVSPYRYNEAMDEKLSSLDILRDGNEVEFTYVDCSFKHLGATPKITRIKIDQIGDLVSFEKFDRVLGDWKQQDLELIKAEMSVLFDIWCGYAHHPSSWEFERLEEIKDEFNEAMHIVDSPKRSGFSR